MIVTLCTVTHITAHVPAACFNTVKVCTLVYYLSERGSKRERERETERGRGRETETERERQRK